MAKKKIITKKKVCTNCARELVEDNFYISNNVLFGGRCPMCKDCLKKMINPDDIGTVYKALQLMDIAFIYEVWKVALEKSKAKTGVFGHYMRMINSLTQYSNYNWSMSSFNPTEVINETNDNKINDNSEIRENDNGEKFEITKDVIDFWGNGFPNEEYEFLETEFTRLTHSYECDSYAMEILFQEVAHQRLTIKKKREKGESVDKELKTLQELLGSANVKPVQESGANATDQETFGTLIKKYENEKPIPEPLPEWKDVDGIIKYISVWFLGHLCKMLGIKNEYAFMYEEEVRKYEVNLPTVEDIEEVDESDIETFENIDTDTSEEGDTHE